MTIADEPRSILLRDGFDVAVDRAAAVAWATELQLSEVTGDPNATARAVVERLEEDDA